MYCCEHLLNPREGSGKSLPSVGSRKLLKEKNPDLIIGVGGCVARKKASTFASAPTMSILFLGRNAAPSAGDDQLRARRPQPGLDISFPEIEKFDRLPEPRAEGRPRLSPSWKAAINIAPTAYALHPW